MTVRRNLDFDLVLPEWLEEAAAPHPVDYLGDVLERTKRTRQRPAWTFPDRWLPFDVRTQPLVMARLAWTLLVLALTLALVAAALLIGSARRLPAPFGLARPGLVTLDMDHHIAVVNADGSGLRLLTGGPEVDISPVWSPDGTLVAYWRATGSGNWSIAVSDETGILRAAIHTQSRTLLPFPTGDPRWSTLDYAFGIPSFLQWSPDSRQIAFSQETNGVQNVWIVRADGSGLTRLGDPAMSAVDPFWSSDGTRIAFCGSLGTASCDGVYVMNADGTGAHRITHVESGGDSFRYPQWQPGGEEIAFIAQPRGMMHVFVVRSDGTGERDISAMSAGDGESDWIQRWSPDGTRIAFVRYGPSEHAIVVANADGSRAVTPPGQSGADVGGPMWAPDGRTLMALVHTETSTRGVLSIDLTAQAAPTIIPVAGNQGGTSWQRLAP